MSVIQHGGHLRNGRIAFEGYWQQTIAVSEARNSVNFVQHENAEVTSVISHRPLEWILIPHVFTPRPQHGGARARRWKTYETSLSSAIVP
jgi:hypothetical protein